MIFNLDSGGIDKKKKPPVFTITGANYDYREATAADGTVNWELAIYGSCTLNFSRVVPVDIWLVGGGGPGTTGRQSGSNCYGGSGGTGGERMTISNETLTEHQDYALVVGGSGQATTAFGRTARTRAGSAGGAGGYAGSSSYTGPYAGTDGQLAFAAHSVPNVSLITSLVGRKYGAGGGGARARSGEYVTSGGGSVNGGVTGGGKGGNDPTTSSGRNGTAGQANTGAGGGGACYDAPATGGSFVPGAGGSGIIIIRNAR